MNLALVGGCGILKPLNFAMLQSDALERMGAESGFVRQLFAAELTDTKRFLNE